MLPLKEEEISKRSTDPIDRCDRLRIIPFHIICRPVVHIASFPVGIITRIEAPTIQIELVGEYKFKFLAVDPAWLLIELVSS